jgi:hypothetical protein
VINVSPLWSLQCLSSGPDQMLRQPALTAKRTMTRAGDVNSSLDGAGAIRERPLRCKDRDQRILTRCGCGRVSGLFVRRRPLARIGSRIHSQTEKRPRRQPPYPGFVVLSKAVPR